MSAPHKYGAGKPASSGWIAALLAASLVLQFMALAPGLWAGSGGDAAGTVIGRELAGLAAQVAALLCLLAANVVALLRRRALPAWARLAPPVLLVLGLLGWYRFHTAPRQSNQPAQRSVVKDGVEYVPAGFSSANETRDKIISAYFMDFERVGPRPNALEPGRYGFEEGTPRGGGESFHERMIAPSHPQHIRWYIWQVGGRTSAGNTYLKDSSVPVIVCDAHVVPYVSPFMDKIYDRSQGKNWRTDSPVQLAVTFYADGKTLGLTIPWGTSNGHSDYNADILKHTVQGDCR